VFQFQSGAIQSSDSDFVAIGEKMFQFQSGAIQRIIVRHSLRRLFGFNSKVVRFKEK